MRSAQYWRVTIALATLVCSCSPVAHAQSAREVAKKVSPSVVLIVMEDSNGQPLAMGSGFVIKDGVVATNLHVIEGASRGYAKLAERKEKFNIAGTVAIDAARDIALLAVEGIKAPALSIADSKELAVGDEVYAVGNPRGLEGTFSAGIISSIRNVGDESLLQITAPISPGSSGGPVVNNKGDVIGVAVATFKGGQNLNFAIPSNYLLALTGQIKAAVVLAKAGERPKDLKAKSILEDLGGLSTDGVTAGQFAWDYDDPQFGGSPFTFSVRNLIREPVRSVVCVVVFYAGDGQPIDTVLVTLCEPVLPGLAKRVSGRVDKSVHAMMRRDGAKAKLEFRILSFDLVADDEPKEKRSDLMHDEAPDVRVAPRPPTPRNAPAERPPDDVEAALRESERKLAEIVAKLAPAGDASDLIETNIDGEFSGWEGETIFKLANGQTWQQVSFAYTYQYAFRPEVMIIKTNNAYKMKVDGVAGTIFVKRLAAEKGEMDLYGSEGVAVAYIVLGEKEAPIYLWSGEPVASLSKESVYGLNGKHLGWYRNGSIYDGEGKLVAAPKDKLVKVKEPDAKAVKKLLPLKGLKELKPLKPLWGMGFSDLPAKAFFLQGTK